MISSEALTLVLTSMVLPSVLVVFLTFVPSIIEWKRPRDAGPRLIQGFSKTNTITPKCYLPDAEIAVADQLTGQKGFVFPAFIYNIEAYPT